MRNTCIYVREKIQKKIDSIQDKIIQKLVANSGEEMLVKYNIDEVWKDYIFILQGVLYRWDICFLKQSQILESLKNLLPKQDLNERVLISASSKCDELSYEFENFLVSFARLYEEPLLVEISRHISRSEQKILRNGCPKRDDENGLFWELNLLRNRSAHTTPGFYTSHNDYSVRYMSISSKIRGIEYIDNKCMFTTQLLSFRKNDYIKDVIRKHIIQEKSTTPLLELLFESTTPKGRGKNNPQILFISNVRFFDLNEEFLELSLDMFKLIEVQLGIFDRSI